MNFPDKTLLDLLEAKYDLTEETIKKTDITWSLDDWSKEKGLYRPYVTVRHLGATRNQPVELMFQFTFQVQVIWWPEDILGTSGMTATKEKVWKIVEKLKSIIEDKTNIPAGWGGSASMRVERFVNATILGVYAECIIEQFVVIAEIYWS
jgi:hypothetical protein